MDNRKGKIEALLRKAEDQSITDAERDAFNEKASYLIAKWGIEVVLEENDGQRRKEEIVKRELFAAPPYETDKAVLAFRIAKALRCQSIRSKRSYGTAAYVVGFESDVERVELLYGSLLLQTAAGLKRLSVPYRGARLAAYKRSWINGFADEVQARLEEAEGSARAEVKPEKSQSMELAIVDRTAQTEAAYRQMFPNARTTYRRLTGRGYGAGRQAGSEANLSGGGRSIGGAGRRQLT